MASEITPDSAQLHAEVTTNDLPTEVTFYMNDLPRAVVHLEGGMAAVEVSIPIDNLTEFTAYSTYAVAVNSLGSSRGETVSFSTKLVAPFHEFRFREGT
jgi:hypothetical protein